MDQIKTGRFIAKLRRKKGLTQEELGKKLGVTNKTISRWENGNYMPDIEALRLLAKEFGISMEELLEGEAVSDEEKPKTPDPFSPKERADFWRRNWLLENKSWFVFWGIIVAALFVFGFLWSSICLWLFNFTLFDGILFGNVIILITPVLCFGLYIYFYNKMCIYVENNAYKLTVDK